jgi:hypothetical protein
MAGLALPTVTLCAAASVNVKATCLALSACLEQVDFAECLLFTDSDCPERDVRVRHVPIRPLRSSADYSDFLLQDLADHVTTPHCLIVQWDGFLLSAAHWKSEFLDYDYIGAPWPQFSDGHAVGNGGFSLRSHKLLNACRDPRFERNHPEDVAICRTNRILLEKEHGIRFADIALAETFAFERTPQKGSTFGFHGIFNLIPLLGVDRFWRLYETLDDRTTAFADYSLLMRQLSHGDRALRRQLRLTVDWLLKR